MKRYLFNWLVLMDIEPPIPYWPDRHMKPSANAVGGIVTIGKDLLQ